MQSSKRVLQTTPKTHYPDTGRYSKARHGKCRQSLSVSPKDVSSKDRDEQYCRVG
jgi:hypothetical protein